MMTAHSSPRLRLAASVLALAAIGALGCSSEPRSTEAPFVPPMESGGTYGDYIIEVNLLTNEVTATPVENGVPMGKGGPNAVIYGSTAKVKFWLFATGLANDPSVPGTKIDTLKMSMENLLTNGVGTHVANTPTTQPRDTIGIFTVVTQLPTSTAGCTPGPTCTVSIVNNAGSASFTSPTPQPYWYRKAVLQKFDGAIDHAGADYVGRPPTSADQLWIFRTSSGVTNFKFGVSVSTPWTPPNGGAESKWNVIYKPDSLPNRSATSFRSEPDWRILSLAFPPPVDTAIQTTGCPGGVSSCLRLGINGNFFFSEFLYYRSDSLGSSQNGFIAATMKPTTTLDPNIPSLVLGLQDETKMAAVGFAAKKVGFIDPTGAFVGPTPIDPTTIGNPTSWRVAKNGATSASLFAPATSTTPLLTISRAQMPAQVGGTTYYFFGNLIPANGPNTTALWSSVVYSIGSASP